MNKRILIVDDEASIRRLPEHPLEEREAFGATLLSATHGQKALDPKPFDPDEVFATPRQMLGL